MPGEKFYEEQEADSILRIAVSDSVQGGAMTRDRLLAIAAEMGISADAVDRAEQQLASQREGAERQKAEDREFAEYRQHRRRSVMNSLSSWISTSIVLVGIDLITTHGITWSIWPVGLWGLVELGQAIQTLLAPAARGEDFARWQRKQIRRAEKREQRSLERDP